MISAFGSKEMMKDLHDEFNEYFTEKTNENKNKIVQAYLNRDF